MQCDVEDKDNSAFHGLHNYGLSTLRLILASPGFQASCCGSVCAGDGVSGWWLLYQKFVRTQKLPSFAEILL